MEQRGSRRVAIAAGDKKQIPAIFSGTAAGEFLPIQLIYAGKTKRCHPNFTFPSDWSITHSQKHWSIEYIEDIILPFVDKTKDILRASSDQPALAIFDHLKGQMTEKVFKVLEKYHIHSILIPPGCTDRLQPMDVSINRAAKAFLERQFQDWYAQQVMENMKSGEELAPVNLSSVMVCPDVRAHIRQSASDHKRVYCNWNYHHDK